MPCFANSIRATFVMLPHAIEVSKPPSRIQSDCSRVEPAVVDLTVVLAEFDEAIIEAMLIMVCE